MGDDWSTKDLAMLKRPETGYVKRALKADGKGGLFIGCGCGEEIPVPVIAGLPMTYECGKCGTVYDSRGWILGKREG
jgi:hypothetical protein